MSIRNKLLSPLVATTVLLSSADKVSAKIENCKYKYKTNIVEALKQKEYIFKYKGEYSEQEIKNMLNDINNTIKLYSVVRNIIFLRLAKILTNEKRSEKNDLIITIEAFKLFSIDLYLFNLNLKKSLYTNFYPALNNYNGLFNKYLGIYYESGNIINDLPKVYNLINLLINNTQDSETRQDLERIINLYNQNIKELKEIIKILKHQKKKWLNQISDKNEKKIVEIKLNYILISLEELLKNIKNTKLPKFEKNKNHNSIKDFQSNFIKGNAI